jgi:MoaA/NifB/PqqE/SkfB family radical SAM enzyme
MKRTFVSVTWDCNDNCISCPVSRNPNIKKPKFKSIQKEIDKILRHSPHIELNGGEPISRKDILKILRYIEKKSPQEIGLLTNAQLFYYKEYAKKISKIKNLKIITTLYGHNSKIHNSITRTPKSFEYKIAGLKNLIECGANIELRILLHKMNYKYFADIANFIVKNFAAADFNRIIIMSSKLTEQAQKHKKAVAEKITQIATVLEKPIKRLIRSGYNIKIYHFPHCVLSKPLWKYSQGITADSTEIYFNKQCKNCIKKKECSGIWISYLENFGSKEFRPITNEN